MELFLFIFVAIAFFSLGHTQGRIDVSERIDKAWLEGYQTEKKTLIKLINQIETGH
jgi:hypothetical protein